MNDGMTDCEKDSKDVGMGRDFKGIPYKSPFKNDRELLGYILGMLTHAGHLTTEGDNEAISYQKESVERITKLIREGLENDAS